MGLRITTWNVNGIRNPFGYAPWNQKRTFQAMFDILESDIVIMQETKIQRKDLRDDMVLVPGWDVFFSLPKHKKGYSGVAIYTRNSRCCPIRAEEGITGILCPPGSSTAFRDLPKDQQIGGYPKPGQLDDAIDEVTLDSEGRCVILEFPGFVLIGVYSPATRNETRAEFRMGFINAMDARVRNLIAMGKEVVLAGDLNIIRDEIDTAKLQEQLKKEGMSFEEFMSMPSRRFLNQLLFEGRVFGGDRDDDRAESVMWDICREFHQKRPGMYTCWETKKNARPGNFGSRIDYIVCSNGIKDWVVDSNIQEGLLGSDHCPVYATLGDIIDVDSRKVYVEDVMNPPDMFKDGNRLREWTPKELLPLSAKLIPEFDRRRSIKDMFFKKAVPSTSKTPSVLTSQPDDGPPSTEQTTSTQASKAEEDVDDELFVSQNSTSTVSHSTFVTRPSPRPSPQKRPSATELIPNRPQKKNKTTPSNNTSSSKASPGLSQSSLTGFFKPKSTSAAGIGSHARNSGEGSPSITESPRSTAGWDASKTRAKEEDVARDTGGLAATAQAPLTEKSKASNGNEDGRVFDPIENKDSWSKLLGKRVVPRCEHDEPCISLVTKKPGVNCGRSFYICPRPLGPSGEKERGTQWRCGTFIWSSDWSKSQS